MNTSPPPTAPLWSADPRPRIDRLEHTHDSTTRGLLHATVAQLECQLRWTRHPETALDRFLAQPANHAARLDAYAALATLSLLDVLQPSLPAWPGWQPDNSRTKRLLRPLEHGLVRLAGLRTDVAAVQIAAMEAGAAPAELPEIAASQVRDEDDGRAILDLPGSNRVAPRAVPIASWAGPALRRLCRSRPDTPLLYGGRAADPADRESAVLMSVRNTFRHARLGHDPTLTPESLRNTGARRAYDAAGSDPLAAAAHLLGLNDETRVLARIDLRPATANTIIDWDAHYLNSV